MDFWLTLGLHFWRSCTGTRLVLYRYKVDGCTGTATGLVPVQGRLPRNPSLRLRFSQGLYRYKGPCTAPTPLGLSPELRRVENQLEAWVWSLLEERFLDLEDFEPCWKLLREPSTPGEARDRGKGIASG
uniref:Uncharacterized protein n=1 Tax=Ananas comosus var. bracteatus TaxID=296719 RepID=A0A6V7NXQ6_ANACO|nr:unnamed protein product [Ananas comosus var. bracteatus]